MTSQSQFSVLAALCFLVIYWIIMEVYGYVLAYRFAPLLRDDQSR